MLFGLVIVGLIVLAAFSINVFLGLALVAFIAWMVPEFVRSWRHENERLEKALKGASATQTLRPHVASDAQRRQGALPQSFGVVSSYDPSGFGVECKLLGAGYSLGFDGKQYVAVSEERLYVGGCYSWGEGKAVPLNDPPVEDIADAIAETVKSLLEG